MILTGPYRLLSESRDFVRDQCIVSAFSRRVGGVPALGTPLFPITPSYRKDAPLLLRSRCPFPWTTYTDDLPPRMCSATVYEISRLGRLTSLPGEYPCQESSHGAFRGWGWKVELSLLLFLLEHGEQPLLTLCRILFPLPRVCKLAFESIDSLLVEFDNF